MIALLFPFAYEMECFLGREECKRLRKEGDPGFEYWVSKSHPQRLLAVTGQGKVETALTAQRLYDFEKPHAFYLLGSATALDPDLKVGDVIVAEGCMEIDFGPGEKPPRFTYPEFPAQVDSARGLLLSGDGNALDPARKARLHAQHGGRALAWEGAGFARFLRRNGATGWEIRMISESAGEGFPGMEEFRDRLRRFMPQVREIVEKV